jgi:hypothetical protein
MLPQYAIERKRIKSFIRTKVFIGSNASKWLVLQKQNLWSHQTNCPMWFMFSLCIPQLICNNSRIHEKGIKSIYNSFRLKKNLNNRLADRNLSECAYQPCILSLFFCGETMHLFYMNYIQDAWLSKLIKSRRATNWSITWLYYHVNIHDG